MLILQVDAAIVSSGLDGAVVFEGEVMEEDMDSLMLQVETTLFRLAQVRQYYSKKV
jgi:hypothetical protein